jgi:hypothetical protein
MQPQDPEPEVDLRYRCGLHVRVTDGVVDGFSFPTAFSFEIDPEFPGNGEWDCPVFNYGRDGRVEPTLESRWGTPMVLRVSPDAAAPWVGMFAAGGLGGVRAVIGCPSPTSICVLADGLAYVVNVEQPQVGAHIVSDQVTQAVAMPEPPLVLFVRFSDIAALGLTGIAWSSKRLCVDDLRVVGVSADRITCTCDNLGGSPTIAVEPTTGEQTAGTTMRDLGWPGE